MYNKKSYLTVFALLSMLSSWTHDVCSVECHECCWWCWCYSQMLLLIPKYFLFCYLCESIFIPWSVCLRSPHPKRIHRHESIPGKVEQMHARDNTCNTHNTHNTHSPLQAGVRYLLHSKHSHINPFMLVHI